MYQKLFSLLVLNSMILSPLWADQLSFPIGGIELGKLKQGDVKSIQFELQNKNSKPYQLDVIIPQGSGVIDVQFPKSIAPGKKATLKFNYNSEYRSGKINEYISIIDKSGESTPIPMTGLVHNPFQFDQSVVDFGYFGEPSASQTIYVWQNTQSVMEQKSEFDLRMEKTSGVSSKFEKVYLDITEPTKVQETKASATNSVFAYKIELTIDTKPIQKSLSKLVAFKSKTHPKATPEVHLVGYKK